MTTDRPGCAECAEKNREIARLRKALAKAIYPLSYASTTFNNVNFTDRHCMGPVFKEALEIGRAALGDET